MNLTSTLRNAFETTTQALPRTSKEHSISRRNFSSKTCGIRRCERRSTTRRRASGRLASPEDGVSISPSKATATFFATSFHIRSRVEHHTGTKKAGSNARLFRARIGTSRRLRRLGAIRAKFQNRIAPRTSRSVATTPRGQGLHRRRQMFCLRFGGCAPP